MIFNSFLMGGFESATHIGLNGKRLDMIKATQHDKFVEEDYKMLKNVGIKTIRDTVRWHLVEKTPGRYSFSSLNPFLQAANKHKIQVIWNLMHYG